MECFLRHEFWGLIFGGAYTWRGFFSEFYGSWSVLLISPETLGTFRSVGTESPTVTGFKKAIGVD